MIHNFIYLIGISFVRCNILQNTSAASRLLIRRSRQLCIDRMDNGLNNTFNQITTPFVASDYDFESVNGCREETFNALNHASGVAPAIGIVFTISTMLIICCHHRLRKKHNIFPFNIVLADCVLNCTLFADYAKSIFGVEGDNAFWVYAIGISYRASHLVSTGSIFLVGIDQFIAFKVDSLGTRNILTKFRRICTCFLTWVIMLLVSTCVLVFSTDPGSVRFALSNLSIVLTGVCYFLVYKTISKAMPCTWGHVLRERRKENKRVLMTYTLILGTTLVFFTLPDLIFFLVFDIGGKFFPSCLFFGWFILQTVNTMINCFIYWWRLREFRAIVSHKNNMSVRLNILSGRMSRSNVVQVNSPGKVNNPSEEMNSPPRKLNSPEEMSSPSELNEQSF